MLLEQIESNQSTVMFRYRGDTIEKILRNRSGGELDRFGLALEKYTPIYASDFAPKLDGAIIVGRRLKVCLNSQVV